MKKSYLIICVICLTLIPTVIAAPIDFDNLHVASTGYGLAGNEGTTRLMAAYNNEIYFILSDDGTANPSKVCRYNPSNGWSNSTNHSIVAETTGRFVTLRQINDLLYFSDTLGNVYSYDGSTLTAMSGTPFTANNYVSSIEEYNGSIYFGTSISSIYRYDGYTYEQVYVYGVSNPQAIVDMAAWQKDGYLYVSVGPRGICCPPTGYTIRSSSGNTGSWEIVFQDVWHTTILMPTPDYLYTAVLDSAYCHCSTVRKSSEGTTFPVIYPSDGQYKVMWGSMYYNGIAYFFADDQMYGFGEIIIDDNGSVSRITNQNWMLTQAVELNGEIYALAGSHRYIPGGVYLLTTTQKHPQNVYHVDAVNGNDNNNGLTPETAFATIGKGIDTAADGNTVLVYPGVYREEVDFKGKTITIQGVATKTGIPIIENPGDFAVSIYRGEGPRAILKNFVVRDSFMAVFIAGSSPTIKNLNIIDNKYGVEAYVGSEPDISNCIFWNNSDSDLFGCKARYSCTSEPGQGNINADPCFVDLNNGDYHLLSQRGRYWPEHDVWVLDKVTSPCVDGGDPDDDVLDEPMPNGGRIDMGSFGGTPFASMSDIKWLDGDINHDGVVNLIDLAMLAENWLENVRP